MTNTPDTLSLTQYMLGLLNKRQTRDEIVSELLQKGHDEEFIKSLLHETIKQRYAKMRSQGLVCILAGAIICLLSFALTITSSYTHLSFPFVLYGLTSLGILVIFAGLVKLF